MQASIIDGTLTEQSSVDGCLANVSVTVLCDIESISSLVSIICKCGCSSSPWSHVCRWFSAMEQI